ncbi:MAG: helix-hairpin-helix domain-containing protein [Ornithinimicrobium sp.]
MPHSPDRAQDLIDALRGSEAAPDEGWVPHGAERTRRQLFTPPSGLRGARLGVKSSAVWGAALLVVLVLIVLGVRVAWAERAAQPEPVARHGGVSATGDITADHAAGSAPPARLAQTSTAGQTSVEAGAPSPTGAVVHVIGAIEKPGVVTVTDGARVSDVVEAAGGATDVAELNLMNLARVVMDGERIWVPVTGADPPPDIAAPAPSPASSPMAGQGSEVNSGPADLVDINTADEAGLQELPGVGPVTAAAIAQWRAEHGNFSTVDELLEVSGIGPRTIETLRPLIQIGP